MVSINQRLLPSSIPNFNVQANDVLRQKWNLMELISYLIPLNPDSVQSFHDLAEKIQQLGPIQPEQIKVIDQLVKNLIFRQFPNPLLDAIREILSNSLDAQARRGNKEPIPITLRNYTFKIADQGDGIAMVSSLIKLLVIGRSSNRDGIEDIRKDPSKVAGRFGQGFNAAFSYLTFDEHSPLVFIPNLKVTDDTLELTLLFACDGVLYEATFSKKEGEDVQISQQVIDVTKPFERITVHTRSKDQSLKMRFFVENKTLKMTMELKEKKEEGTTIRIHSPRINDQLMPQIRSKIYQDFTFVSEPALMLNDEIVNPSLKMISGNEMVMELEPSSHIPFICPFEGGELIFKINNENSQRGELLICEGGRTIKSFPLKGQGKCEQISLNFNQLNLTPERASVDFKDKKNRKRIEGLIRKIFQEPTFTWDVKAKILNSLFPVLISSYFNLIKFVKKNMLEVSKNTLFLPNLPEILSLNIPNAVYLNSSYIDEITLPCFYTDGNHYLYTVKNPTKPVTAVIRNQEKLIFLDEALIHPDNFLYTYFNFALIERGFSESLIDESLHLNFVEIISQHFNKMNVSQSNPESILRREGELKPEAYEQMMEADEVIPIDFKVEVKEYDSSLSKEQQDWIASVLRGNLHVSKIFLSKKCFFYLIDFVKHNWQELNQPNRLQLFTNWIHFIASLKPPVQRLHAILNRILHVVQTFKSPEEFEDCICFIRTKMYFILSTPGLPDSFFQDAYEKHKKIRSYFPSLPDVKANEELTERIYNSLEEKLVDLELYIQLLEKIKHPHLRLKLLPVLYCLRDLDYLCSLEESVFTELISLLPYAQKFSWSSKFTKVTYAFFISLVIQKDYPKLLKAKLSELFFCMFHFQLSMDFLIFLNFKGLFEFFKYQYFQWEHANESSTAFLQDLRKATLDLIKFKEELSSFASKTTFNKLSSADRTFLKQEGEKGLDICSIWDNLFVHNPQAFSLPAGYSCASEVIKGCHFIIELRSRIKDSHKKGDKQTLSEYWIQIWQRAGLIPDNAKAMIFAALMGDNESFLSQNYQFPVLQEGTAGFLHEDPDVASWIGSVETAQIRIQAVINQRLEKDFWIGEYIKNACEGGATEVKFEVHLTGEQEFVVIVKDNGRGMGPEELKALKTPGRTSKQATGANPNFGQGSFSVLAEFPDVAVQTSTDGQICSRLNFTKTEKGLWKQELTSLTEVQPRGTTFILKKKLNGKNPLIELIELKTQFAKIGQYVDQINIFFQNTGFNNRRFYEPVVEYEERYQLRGELQEKPIRITIGGQESAIYGLGNIRLSDIPAQYFALLPESIVSILNKNQQTVTIFLPQAEQILNRGHLMDEKQLTPIIQRAVLVASLKYCLDLWLDGKNWSFLSKDFWDDLSEFDYQLKPIIQRTKRAICNRDWAFLADTKQWKQKEEMIREVRKFFEDFKREGEISFPMQPQMQSFSQLVNAILEEESTTLSIQKLKKIMANELHLNELLFSLPLHMTSGPSLLEIRQEISRLLKEAELLLEDGDYDSQMVEKMSQEELNALIKKSVDQAKENLEDDDDGEDEYHNVFHHFQQSIQSYVRQMKIQQAEGGDPSETLLTAEETGLSGAKELADFFKIITSIYFKKDIEVNFYCLADNSHAKSWIGTHLIGINLKEHFYRFASLISDLQAGISIEAIFQKHEKIICEWLETLAHELVHLVESTDCKSTHDKAFDRKVWSNMEQLLIKKGSSQPTALDILFNALNEKGSQKLKERTQFKKQKLT